MLYTITDMACEICLGSIQDFQNFKSTYTVEWVNGLLLNAQAAAAMPNHQTRQGVITQKRNDVVAACSTVCNGFISLTKYIDDSFSNDQVDALKKIAGNGYYNSAVSKKWQAVKTLITMSLDFINTYADDLKGGGMPDDFVTTYTSNTNTFLKSLKMFNDYKAAVDSETAAKIMANNDVYADLQSMLSDGRHMFKKDAVMKQNFSYTALLSKVKKGGKTGYRIRVEEAQVETPVTTASISLMPTGKTFYADEKGVILCDVPANTYSYTLTAPGYSTLTGTFTIVTGTTHRKNITLRKAASDSAVA